MIIMLLAEHAQSHSYITVHPCVRVIQMNVMSRRGHSSMPVLANGLTSGALPQLAKRYSDTHTHTPIPTH